MDIQTKLYVTRKLDNDLVEIDENKVSLTLKRLAYTGLCILEFSKVVMYEFHYNYIESKYGNNLRLTDNDILMYEIILATIKKCLTLVIIQLN